MSASSYCSQLLWMKHQMVDYNISFLDIPLYCNNVSAINVTKNLVLHSKTKHIEIRHHFIHEHVQKGYIEVKFVRFEEQLRDILTKPYLKIDFVT